MIKNIHSKKGIALPVALLIIMISAVLVTSLHWVTKQSRTDSIFKKEKIRAELLGKGAVQLALLKIRCLPTEFYDANVFDLGQGSVEVTVTSADQDKRYLGRWEREGADKTGNWKLVPADAFSHCFIRELGCAMTIGATNGFSTDADTLNHINIAGPFAGGFIVSKMELISQSNSNLSDAVQFEVYAKEISGQNAKFFLPGGAVDFDINEGITIQEKRILNWKTIK